MISRIIHQIWWQGFDKLPEKFVSNVASIVDANPGYQIYKWDEKSIREVMAKSDPRYLAKLDEFKFLHQRVDFSRIFLLYTYGGISVDTDVVAIQGFDKTPHINSSDFIVSANSSNKFENWVKNGKQFSLNNATILVIRNNPILYGLLEHILGLSCSINDDREKCIQNTTGPKEFTNYLIQYKDQITILPNIYMEPCGGNDKWGCTINPEVSIVDHRHEGSWVSDRNKKISRAWYWLKAHKGIVLGTIVGIILLITLNTKTKTI